MLNPMNVLIPIALVALSVAYTRTRKPKGSQLVPGPSLHLGTRLLMFMQIHFLHTVPEFSEFWCKRYGDIVGVWMNGGYTITTSDVDFAQKILSGTDSKNFISRMGNDDGLKEIGMYNKGIIWNNDVTKWALQRRIFQSGLASQVREKAFVVAGNCAQQEIARIQAAVRDNVVPTVDLLNTLRHITLAVTLDVAFGIELDRERSRRLIDSIVEYFKAWEFFLLKPRFIWFLFPFQLSRHRQAVSNLQELINNLIPTLNPQAAPFLQHLFNNNLSQEEIAQCVLEMILAGTDTSSVSMYYTFLLLTENEAIQFQLLESFRDHPSQNYSFSDSSQDVSLSEAVLREGMRLMPVGPVVIRKAVADCNISGIPIQEGTNIVINLARMNRREKWYDEPLKFNPQRFLQNKDLIALAAPMGGPGPKSCVGQHLAMVEMRPVLREFIKAFKFTRTNHDNKPILETKTKWDIAQQPVHNELLKVLPRKNIIFVGAHSVGKTTLALVVKDRMNAVLVNETARTVMKEMGINADIIRNNPEKSFELQVGIIKLQCEREKEVENEFAVMDRSVIDALVYAKKFCGERWKGLMDLPETKICIERYKQYDKYKIFMIEPQQACLVNDGTRMMPTDYEEWKAFSDEFKIIMNECDIKYRILEELDLDVRFSKVFQTLYE